MNTIRGVNCEGLPSRRKRHARESSFPPLSTEPGAVDPFPSRPGPSQDDEIFESIVASFVRTFNYTQTLNLIVHVVKLAILACIIPVIPSKETCPFPIYRN